MTLARLPFIVSFLVLLFTTSLSAQWTEQNNGFNSGLGSVHFADMDTGWSVGRYGTILYTDDGGNGWSPQTTPVSQYLNDVFFIDQNTG